MKLANPNPLTNRRLKELTECPKCTKTYDDPRILPCVHTFCLRCIQTYIDERPSQDVHNCPMCSGQFAVPESGLGGLSKNFFVEQLTQLRKLLSGAEDDVSCDGCGGTDATDSQTTRKTQTVGLCVECREKLCDGCVDAHKKVRLTRAHRILTLGDEQSSDIGDDAVRSMMLSTLLARSSSCADHPDGDLRLYCVDCEAAICFVCFVESHRQHQCVDVNRAAGELRRRMAADVVDICERETSCRDALDDILDEQAKFAGRIGDVRREIIGRAKRLKQLIDTEKDRLIAEVECVDATRRQRVENAVEELDRYAASAGGFVGYSEALGLSGSAGEIARQASRLRSRAAVLMKTDDVIRRAVDELNSQAVDVAFAAAEQIGDKLVGTVRIQPRPVKLDDKDTPRRSDNDEVIRQLFEKLMQSADEATVIQQTATRPSMTLTHLVRAGAPVSAMTLLNGRLFVVRQPCRQQLEVYDAADTPMAFQEYLCVAGLHDSPPPVVCRLASCSVNNCLYVSDFFADVCYRIQLTTDGRCVVNSERRPVAGGPTGLSVHRDTGNLIITCQRVNRIRIYSVAGIPLREIVLRPSDVVDPLHTVQLTGGQFVALVHCAPVPGVSVVDSGGHVVAAYRNERLSLPGQLVVLSSGDFLLAHRGGDRMLLLNSTLDNARVLALPAPGGLSDPASACFDESRGRMFVGEYRGGRLLVFKDWLL